MTSFSKHQTCRVKKKHPVAAGGGGAHRAIKSDIDIDQIDCSRDKPIVCVCVCVFRLFLLVCSY